MSPLGSGGSKGMQSLKILRYPAKLHSIPIAPISILTSSAANFRTAVKGVLSGTLSLQELKRKFLKADFF